MSEAVQAAPFLPHAAGACPLCAMTGALVALLVLAILAKTLFLAPRGPTLLPLDESCSLNRASCTIQLPDGGHLEFTFGPHPIRLLSPLQLEIRVTGSEARPVEVDFTGVNTPMAFNRAHLVPTGNGVYSAQASLPVCASGSMTWQATLLLQHGERQLLAPFRFETDQTITGNAS